MKKTSILLAILVIGMAFWGCNRDESGKSGSKENFDKDASYALGMAQGDDLKERIEASGIVLFTDEFIKGFSDILKGKNTRFTIEEAGNILQIAFTTLAEELTAEAAKSETAFLAENSRRPGIIMTPSGLQYEIINEAAGPKPAAHNTVVVHYEGTFIDGSPFDSSYRRGAPAEFGLNEVIRGWTEGIQLMSIGSTYRFYIPSDLGYGPAGMSNPYTGEQIIPPYSALIFTVELFEIK